MYSHYQWVSMVFIEQQAQNNSYKHSYSSIIFLQIEMGLMSTFSLNEDGCTVPNVEVRFWHQISCLAYLDIELKVSACQADVWRPTPCHQSCLLPHLWYPTPLMSTKVQTCTPFSINLYINLQMLQCSVLLWSEDLQSCGTILQLWAFLLALRHHAWNTRVNSELSLSQQVTHCL